MGPANKQEIQSIIDMSRNRIFERLERVALKQDMQSVLDCLKNLINVHQQNQQLLRQAEYQRLQLIRRMTAVEARLAQMEQYMRSSKGALTKVAQATSQPGRAFFVGQPQYPGEQIQGTMYDNR